MKLASKYLFEAMDNYPYNLPEAIEALNYALSYDDENPLAHCLQGQIYAEQMKDYQAAIECFETALSYDLYALKVYQPYLDTLLWNGDYEKAEKFIGFALKVKAADKAVLYRQMGFVKEYQKEYKEAKANFKLAKEYTYNDCFMETIKEDLERVKGKIPKKKSKKSKKKNKGK